MADSSSSGGPGLNDLMSLLGGANPLTMISRSINQFQTGVSSFLQSMENFNETMEQMNGVARRINTMLDDIEPVVKAVVPQLTRTMRAADEMVEQMSGPLERVAPGLMRLAETLSSPVLTTFPRDLGQFVEMFGDVARRMQPLGQLAETAGGFFGMNPLAALRNAATGGSTRQTPAPPAASSYAEAASEPIAEPPVVHVFDDEPEPRSERRKAPAAKSGARKKSASKSSASKSSAAAKKRSTSRS
jgi:hypothetical protein